MPRPRPAHRERALDVGIEHLDDRELLALVVERGRSGEPLDDRVGRLLEEGRGLLGLAGYGVGGLVDELGLGLACAARLAAAVELGLRIVRARHARRRESLGDAREVERWGRARLVHLPHEELWAILLDGRNRIVGERQLARGGVHACAVRPNDVLRPVVREAASAFVLVHNHPSGDPCPSREDLELTQKVAVAARCVGAPLVDHVVVADEGYVSLLETGLLDELET